MPKATLHLYPARQHPHHLRRRHQRRHCRRAARVELAPDITYENWLHDVGPDGFYATYERLFGNPLLWRWNQWPATLPTGARLPWANGETWYTSPAGHTAAQNTVLPGPHWILPRKLTCWVVLIPFCLGDSYGATVLLPAAALAQWLLTWTEQICRDRLGHHLHARGRPRPRIPVGSPVQTNGDRLGHPSCEGELSDGTHVHIARTYNGRWVSAGDPPAGGIPFNMGGWVSQGVGRSMMVLIRGAVGKKRAPAARK